MSVEMMVVEQGAIQVNNARLFKFCDEIACVQIDLRSKYAEVFLCETMRAGGINQMPVIWLMTTDETLYIDETKDRDEFTRISFPEYCGWNIFVATRTGEYTVSVCLVKGE